MSGDRRHSQITHQENLMSNNEETSAKTNAWPQGIFAITLFAEDLEQAKEFYQKVFGLPIDFEDSNSAVFKFGGILINLLRITEANELIEPATVAKRESGNRFVFTISVDDVDAMSVELVSRGVELLNGPMDRPWGIRTASFMDPAGYIWEIAH
jgi:catechol 2,3-dioxygenase-like lactoylglutathione lyase family enzyme